MDLNSPSDELKIQSIDAEKIVKFYSSLLELKATGIKKEFIPFSVDPIRGFPIHIDFLAIDMNKPVEVSIPIEFIGLAPAEKNGLGVLVKVIHEVEIEALPKDLPHGVSVDISVLLNLNDQIHVKDIILPIGVKMITQKDEVVALITQIKEEIVEEKPVDLSAIEVEKKGKKDDEEVVEKEAEKK
jgi:large subunit ribosomal protein L25